MNKVKEVYFKVQAEFICDLARQQYWLEDKPQQKAIEFLTTSFDGLTDDMAKQILTGKKLLAGLYPDEEIKYIDDDKHEDYLENLRNIKIKERIMDPSPLTPFEEYMQAYKTLLPSYCCRMDNHEMDNSTVDWRPEEHCRKLVGNNWKLLGVCLEPEFKRGESIGLVIEDQNTFSRFWYHGQDIDCYKRALKMMEER